MGAGASLTEASTTDEIAEGVKTLGGAFEAYASVIRDNGVDGELLISYGAEHNADDLLDDLEVTNKLHRKKLMLEIEKLKEIDGASAEEGMNEGAESPRSDPFAELILIAEKIEPKSLSESVQVDDVNHLFISYRQNTETQLATRLYNGTKAIVADRDFAVAGKKPKIFFDRKSLSDGEKWEVGFVNGLLTSLILLPLISWDENDGGSVGQLMNLEESDHVDNVLLEWELGLVLMDMSEADANKSLMRSIFPILIGDTDDRGFLSFPFEKLDSLPSRASLATKKRLLQICVEHSIPCSAEAITRSVKDTVYRIVESQGVKLEDLGKEEVAIESCAARIFDKGSQTLLELGLQSSPSSRKVESEAVAGAATVPVATGLPPPVTAVALTGAVASAPRVAMSKLMVPPTVKKTDLGQCTFGSPFSVECLVDIFDPEAAPMYSSLFQFDELACFTNGGTKENPQTGVFRVKFNNDNKHATGYSVQHCLGKNRRAHLVVTCGVDGTRTLYLDGRLVQSHQNEKWVVPCKARNLCVGHDSGWIAHHALTIYSEELSSLMVCSLARSAGVMSIIEMDNGFLPPKGSSILSAEYGYSDQRRDVRSIVERCLGEPLLVDSEAMMWDNIYMYPKERKVLTISFAPGVPVEAEEDRQIMSIVENEEGTLPPAGSNILSAEYGSLEKKKDVRHIIEPLLGQPFHVDNGTMQGDSCPDMRKILIVVYTPPGGN